MGYRTVQKERSYIPRTEYVRWVGGDLITDQTKFLKDLYYGIQM